MGDRTTVQLTVLDRHVDFVKECDDGGDEICNDDGTTTFVFYDVNYGDLDYGCEWNGDKGVVASMLEANIPHDIEWDSGCEYPAGSQHFRVLEDGSLAFTEIGSIETRGMVSVNEVVEAMQTSSDPSEALGAIQALLGRTMDSDYPPITLLENGDILK